MRFVKMMLLAVIAASAFTPAQAQVSGEVVVDEVIVKINGDIVTRSQFNELFSPIDGELTIRLSGEQLDAERTSQKSFIFNMLINRSVVEQRAREGGVGFPERVFTERVEEIKRQIGAMNDEDFRRALADQGMTWEQFREQFAYQYYIQVLFGNEVGRDLYQSESRLQSYYEENIERYREPERMRLSQIVIPYASEAEKQQAGLQAQAAVERLKAGDDFGEVYRAVTEGADEEADGDIGYIDPTAFRKDLVEKITGLEEGACTDVVDTGSALLIIKLTERKESEIISLEKIQDRVLMDMQQDTYSREIAKYITRLKQRSLISVVAKDFEGLYQETFYEGERR